MASTRSPGVALIVLGLAACTDPTSPADTVAFDLGSTLTDTTFWDLPFPSDLRLTPDGRPDLAGFPNRRKLPVIDALLSVSRERKGFPVMPIAWFRFTATPPAHALDHVILPATSAEALLIDVDPGSPERGTLHAVVAQTLADDAFTGAGLVALAPRPGIVLRGHTRYAYALRKTFAPGTSVPPAFAELADGHGPDAARALYAPLWDTLDLLGIARSELLVATVFTTGDEVELLYQRSEAVRASSDATIANLHVVASHPDFCDLAAEVTVPQFQVGTPPFPTDGQFVLDASGAPIPQSSATIPLRITIPRGMAMPAAGWPLWQFFHGSGGASFDLVDEGPSLTAEGPPLAGEGVGAVVARVGIAAAGAALPINPERVPQASSYAYININNLAAFPYTFQQGVFEQRLLLDALLALDIPEATVASCGLTGAQRFDPATLTAGGHSMGAMYTNMIGAVEPRFGALTPFGAGGFWNMMILDTSIIPGARSLLAGTFGVDPDQLSFVHPTLALIGLGWEIAEPGAAMARLARRPLPGMPARHVYQPVGLDDKFFPNPVFDAAALAYGNEEAGDIVWPGTQDALRVDGLDGVMPYPVKANRGTTSVVVQYHDDGILDAHYIYRQLAGVRNQYSCFLHTYVRDGVPTVPAPDAACP